MKIVLSLIICVFALPTLAGQGSYFKGGLGYSIGGETESDINEVGFAPFKESGDLDNAFIHPLLIAYGTYLSDSAAVEFELTYRDNEYTTEDNNTGDLKTLLLGVNGIFHTNFENSPVKPFIGAGLVVGNYEIGDLDSEFGAGLQVIAGLDLLMNQKSSIGLELRHHIQVISPETDLSGDKIETDLTMTDLLVTYKVSL